MKIRPVRAELFHAGRQEDSHEEADSRVTSVRLASKVNDTFAADVYRCLQFRPWGALSSLNVIIFKTQVYLTYWILCAFVQLRLIFGRDYKYFFLIFR
jgi:hypothetical protein